MNVFLIGYRGSGKTTVAAALAARLDWPWLDADVELERRAGRTIKELFAEQGERAFRDLESEIIAELANGDRRVVACGGGVVLREQNRAVLRSGGKCVWLRASPEALLERIEGDATTEARRPNLTGHGGLAEIRTLLAERTPLYEACADLQVDAERHSPMHLADQIIAELKLQE
jgi:shikimate kinase